MRDREYSESKPANTYRIVLVGGSHDVGLGVKDNETYENLVENWLNNKPPEQPYSQYQILNLAVGGSDVLQRLLWLEQRGFRFGPDAAMFSVAAHDQQFLIEHLSKVVTLDIAVPPGYAEIFNRIVGKARLHKKMPAAMIEGRLRPYIAEIYQWAFERFATECRARGIRPFVIYRPAPADLEHLELASRSQITHLAGVANVEMIDLSDAFDSVSNRDTLIVAKWDHHTTALGHVLLADKLYERLVPLLSGPPNIQRRSWVEKR